MNIEQLHTEGYQDYIKNDAQNFVSSDFLLLRDAIKVNKVGEMETGKPYRISEGRLLLITQGRAIYQMNMIDYELEPSTAFVVPSGSIVVVKEVDEEFNLQSISMKDMGENSSFPNVLQVKMNNEDWLRISEYVNLIWEVIHRRSFSVSCVRHLQAAMLDDLKHIFVSGKQNTDWHPTHAQDLFSKFVRLVNEHGSREHHVRFYADHLFLTPNRLSNLVKEQSGETVLQWVNRAIILEAKVLLRYSDMKNYEIAERLNFPNASFFNKFFKKQTGLTPLEYKNS
jgi:AraC-like DNA-binding protein